jgi:hypothetical protein
MPPNPQSKRYQRSKDRGFVTLSITEARKRALAKKAAALGYPALQDYVWALATGQEAPDSGLEALRAEAQKEIEAENKKVR